MVRELLRRKGPAGLTDASERSAVDPTMPAEERISNREEVEKLLSGLRGQEADVVRMYHLEGRSYQEISSRTGMPENSVGPTLSRAREKLRRNPPMHS